MNDLYTKSFFKNFSIALIFTKWNCSLTLLELAQSLGFSDQDGLKRVDYEYINSVKTRDIWKKYILQQNRNQEFEKQSFFNNLSDEELQIVLDYKGIETVSHLSLHFLMSGKHGIKVIKTRILNSPSLVIKKSLYKGIYGKSSTPNYWPTRFYTDIISSKPMICPLCNFKATESNQIELHHMINNDSDYGPKKKRNLSYYKTKNIQPMCANCHCLQHRDGKKLFFLCGKWKKKIVPCPFREGKGNQKYKNPDTIFTSNCKETYRVQKQYFLKWHLTSSNDYKCSRCGVTEWLYTELEQADENLILFKSQTKKLLSLELHHKDSNQQNSLIENLELLCPNCHRFFCPKGRIFNFFLKAIRNYFSI